MSHPPRSDFGQTQGTRKYCLWIWLFIVTLSLALAETRTSPFGGIRIGEASNPGPGQDWDHPDGDDGREVI